MHKIYSSLTLQDILHTCKEIPVKIDGYTKTSVLFGIQAVYTAVLHHST